MANALEEVAIASSPYPLVSLATPQVPRSGLHYPAPKICHKVWAKGHCLRFYRSLPNDGARHECPYGFSSFRFQVGTAHLAATGIISTPRAGSDSERARAKEYPLNRVAETEVQEWVKTINEIVRDGDKQREQEFSRRLEALHEIRRFNQIVRTNLERTCLEESPLDPDAARVDLVRAHRASALISVQLDALDLLANPATAMSFEPRPRVFYKVVDKIVRMYRVIGDSKGVKIRMRGSSTAKAKLDVRTEHIIPSVFIDNAIKYARHGDLVDVFVSDYSEGYQQYVSVEVTSLGPVASEAEEQRLFLQRGRGHNAEEFAQGSGVGLTLAKVVADQHGGRISASQRSVGNGLAEWVFRFQLLALSE
jgi:Histidine kinase-, DNA gyrase B-, and HSP90-like ATPase